MNSSCISGVTMSSAAPWTIKMGGMSTGSSRSRMSRAVALGHGLLAAEVGLVGFGAIVLRIAASGGQVPLQGIGHRPAADGVLQPGIHAFGAGQPQRAIARIGRS